jgi:hypothetical protein
MTSCCKYVGGGGRHTTWWRMDKTLAPSDDTVLSLFANNFYYIVKRENVHTCQNGEDW